MLEGLSRQNVAEPARIYRGRPVGKAAHGLGLQARLEKGRK